jgi:hypothetical protein
MGCSFQHLSQLEITRVFQIVPVARLNLDEKASGRFVLASVGCLVSNIVDVKLKVYSTLFAL